jgi:hypothetical protein
MGRGGLPTAATRRRPPADAQRPATGRGGAQLGFVARMLTRPRRGRAAHFAPGQGAPTRATDGAVRVAAG